MESPASASSLLIRILFVALAVSAVPIQRVHPSSKQPNSNVPTSPYANSAKTWDFTKNAPSISTRDGYTVEFLPLTEDGSSISLEQIMEDVTKRAKTEQLEDAKMSQIEALLTAERRQQNILRRHDIEAKSSPLMQLYVKAVAQNLSSTSMDTHNVRDSSTTLVNERANLVVAKPRTGTPITEADIYNFVKRSIFHPTDNPSTSDDPDTAECSDIMDEFQANTHPEDWKTRAGRFPPEKLAMVPRRCWAEYHITEDDVRKVRRDQKRNFSRSILEGPTDAKSSSSTSKQAATAGPTRTDRQIKTRKRMSTTKPSIGDAIAEVTPFSIASKSLARRSSTEQNHPVGTPMINATGQPPVIAESHPGTAAFKGARVA